MDDHLGLKLLVDLNLERWPADSEWNYDQYDYKMELALLRLFIHRRLGQLDERIEILEES